jgi:hypothetical protein
MRNANRAVAVLAGVLLTGQVARADAHTLPTLGVGAGAFRKGSDKTVSFVTDLFLGMDVRAEDALPGLKRYPAFIARGHLLLGGGSRFEPRAYLVLHTTAWGEHRVGGDSAVALGAGPSIPLGSDTPVSLGLFAQATGGNILSLELGVRALAGPLDLSATVQFDVAQALLLLHRALGDH